MRKPFWPPPPGPLAVAEARPERLVIAKLGAAVGLRGEMRIQVFGKDPQALLGYALTDDQGREVRIAGLREGAKGLVARLDGVTDRTGAERLRNLQLFVMRDSLPAPEAENEDYYHADLIGLRVVTKDGAAVGHVTRIFDFGAGDLLEVTPPADAARGKAVLIPFTRAIVPEVNIVAAHMVIDPPPGLLDLNDGKAAPADRDADANAEEKDKTG